MIDLNNPAERAKALEHEKNVERIRREAKRAVVAEERDTVKPPEILTLRERLARPRRPVFWRIVGFQAVGHRVLLAAQFKAGKTTLTANVVRSMLDGDAFLDTYDVSAIAGVLVLLDFEMSEHQLDDWYRDQNIENDDRLLVIPMRGAASSFDITNQEVRGKWAQLLKSKGVKYLILDCLRPVLDALGLNEHNEAGLFLTALDALLRDAEIPEALVIHHMGHKSERARGEGLRTIASELNAMGAPRPRAQQGRRSGWSFGTVREVLRRPLYRGEVVWGRTASAYGRELGKRLATDKKREKGQIPKPEETWIRKHVPELRIIDSELEARVDARLAHKRSRYFASVNKKLTAPKNEKAKRARAASFRGVYLLSGGMLICPTCKGHFEAYKSPWKKDYAVYVCSTRRRKPGVCPNTLALPIEQNDELMLSFLEGEVLKPQFVEELLCLVDKDEADDTAHVLMERDRLQTEISNLLGLVASGVSGEAIGPEIRKREAEIDRLEARLRIPKPGRPDIAKVRAALTFRVDEWKATLRGEPKMARVVLRRLVEPIVVHDESERPEWIPYGDWKRDETSGIDWVFVPCEAAVKAEALLAAAYTSGWRPQRDSNPCFGLERATS